uniref:Enolase n=1 Tax=candidate division WOR-3 bacterium TaxID=2052148 RepID=A0A7V5Y0G0_UNCW3
MSKIKDLKAREILDSRGLPTIEVECYLVTGEIGRASIPAGASKGKYEALEVRDNEKRYFGKGVKRAIQNIEVVIKKELIGLDVLEQKKIDNLLKELDGTENKSNLGANAILGVSLACAKAASAFCKLPLYRYLGGINTFTLPVPYFNIINGGLHAGNNLDIQEYMIVPLGIETFREKLRAGSEIFHTLKNILKKEGKTIGLGDEGGFAANFENNEEPLKYLTKAIEEAGYEVGKEIFLAIDAASSNFYDERANVYYLKLENKKLSSEELIEYYENWIANYPIIAIEDGLSEEDWEGWQKLTQKLAEKIQLIGDDIFVTNIERLKRGIEKKVANGILIKPNQIGTLTETMECINFAKENGYKVMISHRSGETEDAFIADLAVATNAGQIKTGAPQRGERIAKYNQLLRIEEELF